MRAVRPLVRTWPSRRGADRVAARAHRAEDSGARRRPRWVVIVTSGCLGSAFGLAFGVGALNRPLANGLLFYALGFFAGVLLAVAVTSLRRAGSRGG
jgi:hypothetical protein